MLSSFSYTILDTACCTLTRELIEGIAIKTENTRIYFADYMLILLITNVATQNLSENDLLLICGNEVNGHP